MANSLAVSLEDKGFKVALSVALVANGWSVTLRVTRMEFYGVVSLTRCGLSQLALGYPWLTEEIDWNALAMALGWNDIAPAPLGKHRMEIASSFISACYQLDSKSAHNATLPSIIDPEVSRRLDQSVQHALNERSRFNVESADDT